MNKRPLHLSILTLALIVVLTSCNRQNTPEFASGRFHHKEKTNKQADQTALALQRRDKIEPLTTKAPVELELQTTTSTESLRLLTIKNNVASHSKAIANKHSDNPVTKDKESEASTSVKALFNPGYSSNVVEQDKQSSGKQIKGRDNGDRLLCAIIAIFIPFLGVGLYEGLDGNFWIDLILTFLFYFPGLIFALIVILSD